jgi:hypothetical protein
MGESQPGTGHHTSKRIAVCRRIASATSTGESVVNKSFWKTVHPRLLIEAVAAGIDPKASPQCLPRFASIQMQSLRLLLNGATKGELWLATEQ